METESHLETIEGGYLAVYDESTTVRAHPVLEWECTCGADLATQGTQPVECDDCEEIWRIRYP